MGRHYYQPERILNIENDHKLAAELAAKESELRVKTLIEMIPAALVMISPQSKIISVNPQFEHFVGEKATSLAGQDISDFLTLSDSLKEQYEGKGNFEILTEKALNGLYADLSDADGKLVGRVLVRSSGHTFAFRDGAMLCIAPLPELPG